ncbi:MAG TPA: TIGR01777 family oxidoreductase [Nitrospiraceae bacterium]|nr:TIGR01777 family oxidoreductase [Nitrospiraceae bacterium]
MRIIVTGGTGFIGHALVQTLLQNGHAVTVLTRRACPAQNLLGNTKVVEWNPMASGSWEQEFSGVDAVINLAGEPIADGRWTESRKHSMTQSRIDATKAIVEALRAYSTRPCTLINASGIGYYGTSNGISIYETVGAGNDFLADLCVKWEGEARRAEDFGVRVVRLRFGMVLENDGGALAKMVLPFRLFLGGPIMPGTQWVSWIHRQDVIGLVQWALSHLNVTGAVNAVSPDPVTMRTFCRTIGQVLNRPSWLPVPQFILRAGLGELGTVMTTGQRVLPQAALQGGYTFFYPTLEPALRAVFFNAGARGMAAASVA